MTALKEAAGALLLSNVQSRSTGGDRRDREGEAVETIK